MKKALITAAKCLAFILAWALIISLLIPELPLSNPALENLWYEFMPLLYTVLVTLIFVFVVDKRKVRVPFRVGFGRNLLLGLAMGIGWFGLSMGILLACGVAQPGGQNAVGYLAVWVLASLLNVAMQELLVRGYLYQLLRKNAGLPVAMIGTTAFFTVLHGGAFEAGWIAVCNVLTMSIFITLLLEYADSIVAPIVAHFVWNTVAGIGFGAISLGFAYPSLINMTFTGNALLSGGAYKMEGSIVVLIVNLALIALLIFMLRRKRHTKATQS